MGEVSLDDDEPSPAARQLPSHRTQLVPFDPESLRQDRVDAIIVPTVRPVDMLKEAVELARHHRCALVVLCSKEARASDVVDFVCKAGLRSPVVAIDVRPGAVPDHVLPGFSTDELIAGTPFARESDLSLKRNLALLLARRAGWRRIVFLDDDIVVPDFRDLGRAAWLLREFPAVGLGLEGFPDNSVVCHANREAGEFQETFIGGGAMAVNVRAATSFFPNIYNEDWFFLADENQRRRSAVVGRATQQEYDPFDAGRARGEEFGDCLAEGLYALVDTDQLGRAKTTEYWQEFLAARRRLIADIMTAVARSTKPLEEKLRIHDALTAARECSEAIEATFCVEYLRRWHADQETWRIHLRDVPQVEGEMSPLLAAARRMGLGGCTSFAGLDARPCS